MESISMLNDTNNLKDFDVDDIINKFMLKGFEKKTAAKITIILFISPSLLDAQDMLLIEFKGNYEILNICMDVVEDYYNKIITQK